MNTAIQYRGHLNSTESINRICKKFQDIARVCEWDYKILDDELSEPEVSCRKEGAEANKDKEQVPSKGIQLKILNDYELNILFYDTIGNFKNTDDIIFSKSNCGNLSDITVRTKFPPKNMHITVIKLLEYLKENYYNSFEVVSERK